MNVIDQINESGIFAQSAYSADTATNDSLGRNISETYQTTAGMTAYQPSGDYISAKDFKQRISNANGNKFISFWNEAGGSTATAVPAIYLSGQFGSAYYKENELKLGRNSHIIAFNIGGAGPKISAAATGTADSFMCLYNTAISATINQSGLNIKNSTANENVTIASIQSWNAKGDMHESSFSYDGNNKISAYNGSAFSVEQVVTSTGGNANYVNKINNRGISATVAYKARLDEGNHSISALYDTVSTNSGSWQTPADVMMETGLEYNAVNEISGYNGSAIAQYGAEKQWLVHDDTLVHVANSAQYALGCNISALQRLMGIDETVLFEGMMSGTLPVSASLSDTPSAFKTLKFIAEPGIFFTCDGSTTRTRHLYGGVAGGTIYNYAVSYAIDNANKKISLDAGRAVAYCVAGNSISNYENCTATNYGELRLVKVIGIGRKEV